MQKNVQWRKYCYAEIAYLGLVVNLCNHLLQEIVQPEYVCFRIEITPVVVIALFHHPVDVELVVSARLQSLGREQCRILRQVLEYGAVLIAAR